MTSSHQMQRKPPGQTSNRRGDKDSGVGCQPTQETTNCDRNSQRHICKLQAALRELESAANARIIEQNKQLAHTRVLMQSLSVGYFRELQRRRIAYMFGKWRRFATVSRFAAIPYPGLTTPASQPTRNETGRAGISCDGRRPDDVRWFQVDSPVFDYRIDSQEEAGSEYLAWLDRVGHSVCSGMSAADMGSNDRMAGPSCWRRNTTTYEGFDTEAAYGCGAPVGLNGLTRGNPVYHGDVSAADQLLHAIPHAAADTTGRQWQHCWQRLQAVVDHM
eukprot:scaffold85269_cov36-Prasinocladus_malaysianus.AAC.1